MDTVITNTIERSPWRDRVSAYARFVKIEHTLFSLPLLYAGAVLAGAGWPSWRIAGLILVAGTGARTLALSLNRIIDRDIDKKNPRTSGRELATGALSLGDAILISVASLLAYVWSALALSDFCLMWCWVPVLFFLIYPTLKRFTSFSHFGLGLTWSLAPLGGWFAVKPGFETSWPALLLGLFSFFWLSGFDIIYATKDEEFDRRESLYSLPMKLGSHGALKVSSLLHWAAFFTLVVLYTTALNGVGAAFLLLVGGFLLFLEHLFVSKVDLSFFKINVITGFVVLGMIILGVGKEF